MRRQKYSSRTSVRIERFHNTAFVGKSDNFSFYSIQSAIDFLAKQGGGIIYLEPGEYKENLLFTENLSISSLSPNSDAGTPGNTAIIEGCHTPPNTGSIILTNVLLRSSSDIFNSNSSGSAELILENLLLEVQNGYIFKLPNWNGKFIVYNLGDNSIENGVIYNVSGAECFFISATLGSGTQHHMVVTGKTTLQEIDLNCPLQIRGNASYTLDYSIFTKSVECAEKSKGTFSFCSLYEEDIHCLKSIDKAEISISHSHIKNISNPLIIQQSMNDIEFINSTLNSPSKPLIFGEGKVQLNGVQFIQSDKIDRRVKIEKSCSLEISNLFVDNLYFKNKKQIFDGTNFKSENFRNHIAPRFPHQKKISLNVKDLSNSKRTLGLIKFPVNLGEGVFTFDCSSRGYIKTLSKGVYFHLLGAFVYDGKNGRILQKPREQKLGDDIFTRIRLEKFIQAKYFTLLVTGIFDTPITWNSTVTISDP